MNRYLGARLDKTRERLRLIADVVGNADNWFTLKEVSEALEAQVQLIRIYQYEWQQQLMAGMKAEQTPQEVSDLTQDGLLRIV